MELLIRKADKLAAINTDIIIIKDWKRIPCFLCVYTKVKQGLTLTVCKLY